MGLAIAQAAKKMGNSVVIAGRSQEKLAMAQKILDGVEAHTVDVRDEKSVKLFFDKVGAFDHLVLTAASFIMGPFLKLNTADVRSYFDSKFWGQYNAAKHGAPFIRKGGSITFFGGAASQKPICSFAFGSALNAAIEGLTRGLALELAPIRVNAIAPGIVETPAWDLMDKKERASVFKQAGDKLLTRRIGQPEDIAEAAIYLMHCGFATGSVLYVDGGDRLI